MSRTICLNADIGELPGETGRALDRAILDVVSRCSIACGGHAGDEDSMRATLKAAKARNVVAGAHPSYPDKQNFGRQSMKLPPDELEATLRQQVRTLSALARLQGVVLDHLKPHGALYNDAARDAALSQIIARVARQAHIRAILGPPNSALGKVAATSGLEFISEGFADRRYDSSGALVSRSKPDAVLIEPSEQIAQVVQIAEKNSVTTNDGKLIHLAVETICLHGDTPGAVQSALSIRDALRTRKIDIKAQLPQ